VSYSRDDICLSVGGFVRFFGLPLPLSTLNSHLFFFALPNNNNTHTHHDVLSRTASRPIQWRAVFSFFVLFSIPINALYLPVCEYATPTPNPTLASCPRFVLTDGIFWPFSFIHSISSPFRAASFLVHLFRCVGLVRFSLTQKINFS